MKWFLNIRTKSKLMLGFGLLVAILATVIVMAYLNISTIQQSQQELYDKDFKTAISLENLLTDMSRIRAILPMIMLSKTTSEMTEWNNQVKPVDIEIAQLVVTIRTLLQDNPNLAARFESVAKVIDINQKTRMEQEIPLMLAGKKDEANVLLLGIQQTRYEQINNSVKVFADEEVSRAGARLVQSQKMMDQSMQYFGILGACMVLLGVIMIAAMNAAIATPLRDVTALAIRISQGDLTAAQRPSERKDEIGVLNRAFDTMTQGLREITRDIIDGANVIASASGEIMASTAQVTSGAAETAAAVSETTSSIEEVKQTAQFTTGKAKSVADAVQKTVEVSDSGWKAVEKSIEVMDHIQNQVESIAQSLVRLSEQSQTIGAIIETVNDLAEQSNLLAVNAAIEAAKAGEQGKGFAVVAQEVKILAEQSKDATSQVRTILNDILKATNTAVLATEQGSKAVAAGVSQSREAGESIRQMTERTETAAQSAVQILASNQQQLTGLDQIALSMENIRRASDQNVVGMRQVELTVENLHDLGQRLKLTVERYTI